MGNQNESDNPRIPNSLRENIAQGKVIPFVGAGISMSVKSKELDEDGKNKALFPSWKMLLLSAAKRLEEEGKAKVANLIRSQLEMDDEDAGEYYLNAAKQAQKHLGASWYGLLQEELSPRRSQVEDSTLNVARAIWKLNSQLLITTNYDKVLHWACPEEEREDLRFWDIESIYSQIQSLQGENQRPTVWHLHGHIDNPNNLILTPKGYAELYPTEGNLKARYQSVLETLKSHLSSKSFLFLGFSFVDQDFSNLFRLISESIFQGERPVADGQLRTASCGRPVGVQPIMFLPMKIKSSFFKT